MLSKAMMREIDEMDLTELWDRQEELESTVNKAALELDYIRVRIKEIRAKKQGQMELF